MECRASRRSFFVLIPSEWKESLHQLLCFHFSKSNILKLTLKIPGISQNILKFYKRFQSSIKNYVLYIFLFWMKKKEDIWRAKVTHTSGIARIFFWGAVKITCEGAKRPITERAERARGGGGGRVWEEGVPPPTVRAFCILMLLMVQFGAKQNLMCFFLNFLHFLQNLQISWKNSWNLSIPEIIQENPKNSRKLPNFWRSGNTGLHI